jgi:hypothetical protein
LPATVEFKAPDVQQARLVLEGVAWVVLLPRRRSDPDHSGDDGSEVEARNGIGVR